MSLKKVLPIVSLAAATLLALTACGGGQADAGADKGQSTTDSLKKVTLMMNFTYSGHHSPVFYGIQQGYFKDAGIDLTVEPGGGSLKTVQAVGAGHADFGWSDAPSIITGVGAGVAVHGLGAFEQSGSSAVISLADEGITSPKDLEGKSVGITPGDALSQTFPAFLRANDVDPSTVKIVNVDAASKIAVLVKGSVDAIVGFDENQAPVVAQKSGKKVDTMLYSDYGIPMLGLGLLTSNKLISSDPDLVQSMYNAMVKSWTEAAAHPDAAIDAIEAAVGQQLPDKALLLEQLKRQIPLLHSKDRPDAPVGSNTEEQWKTTLKLLVENGAIEKAGSPDEYWDNTFQKKAGA
ncbi:ABC transporter substrate-binding protein [Microbacterium sp. STN6]|uniref:ABC transporter substrate-binding protein n=1 Tax=Microbacterium sp. STN6 TaxID=2995588 RepID=UPI0022609808|nr:ABC transporter substrate-binding protein [Microbacterium sp. STN6]MCX7522814.1 ABC transporter substrate-binding protein [Microbacterium sp. STN6]